MILAAGWIWLPIRNQRCAGPNKNAEIRDQKITARAGQQPCSSQPSGRPTSTTMMAKALVRDAPPAAMGLMDSAHGLG